MSQLILIWLRYTALPTGDAGAMLAGDRMSLAVIYAERILDEMITLCIVESMLSSQQLNKDDMRRKGFLVYAFSAIALHFVFSSISFGMSEKLTYIATTPEDFISGNDFGRLTFRLTCTCLIFRLLNLLMIPGFYLLVNHFLKKNKRNIFVSMPFFSLLLLLLLFQMTLKKNIEKLSADVNNSPLSTSSSCSCLNLYE